MKRKVIIMLIAAFAMLMSTAYAEGEPSEANKPEWVQSNNEVQYTAEKAYKTVLITEKTTDEIFYVGQNTDGYMGKRAFLIKNNPQDGQYLFRMGGLGETPLSEEFSILTYYAVTANVNEHVDTVKLVNGNDEFDGTILNGVATFAVPKGTYTVSFTCKPGWHETGRAASVAVNGSCEVNLEITVAENTYTVSGTADEHITHVALKKGDVTTTPAAVTLEDGVYKFSVADITAGAYEVIPAYADEYELNTMKLGDTDVINNTVTVSGAITNLNITSKQKTYKVTAAVDEHITAVKLVNGSTKYDMTAEGGKLSVSVPKGEYTFEYTFAADYELAAVASEKYQNNKLTVGAAVSDVVITSKAKKYNVSIAFDSNVSTVKVGSIDVKTADGSETSPVTIQLEVGNYTATATAKDGYELASASISFEVKTGGTVAPETISFTTSLIKYTVSGTAGDNVQTVKLMKDGSAAYTKSVINNSFAIEDVEPGEYTVAAEFTDGSDYKIKSVKVNNETAADNKITVTNANISTISIETEPNKYPVTAAIDEHVEKITLKNGNNSYTGTKNGNTATFNVPKGAYTIEVVCSEGYKMAGESTTEVTVAIGGAYTPNTITVTTEKITEPVYIVTGKADEGVDSVKLKNIESNEEIVGAISSEAADGKYTVTVNNVVSGTYQVIVSYKNHYESNGTAIANVTVSGGAVTNAFDIVSKRATYTVSGTVDAGVKSVTLKKNGSLIKEGEIIGAVVTFTGVIADTYDVVIEYNDEREIDGTEPTTYTVENNASDIFNIRTKAIRYAITVTLGANVSDAVILDENNTPITGEKNGSTVTFSVTAGTYTVSATAEEGYDIDAYTPSQSVTVNKDNPTAEEISVTAAEQEEEVYAVSGTVDEGTASVVIKHGETVAATITEFTDNMFSYNLPAGEYTIKVVPKEGYEIDGETDTTEFEVINQAVEVILAKTKIKEIIPTPSPNSSRTETEKSESVDGNGNDTIVLTAKLKNVSRYNLAIAAAYNKNGTLISVKRHKIGDGEEEIRFEFEKNIEIDKFRILVWDSLTRMNPITDGEGVPNTP